MLLADGAGVLRVPVSTTRNGESASDTGAQENTSLTLLTIEDTAQPH